jgi:hypothetical protein
LYQSSKITGHEEVTKPLKSRFFSIFLLVDRKGSGSRSASEQLKPDPDPGGPKTFGSGTLLPRVKVP